MNNIFEYNDVQYGYGSCYASGSHTVLITSLTLEEVLAKMADYYKECPPSISHHSFLESLSKFGFVASDYHEELEYSCSDSFKKYNLEDNDCAEQILKEYRRVRAELELKQQQEVHRLHLEEKEKQERELYLKLKSKFESN